MLVATKVYLIHPIPASNAMNIENDTCSAALLAFDGLNHRFK
jgi:hypothetical protein